MPWSFQHERCSAETHQKRTPGTSLPAQLTEESYECGRHTLTNASAYTMKQRMPQSGDVYFSADVETDGPIPGPYSMLSFALVPAGIFDGQRFVRPADYEGGFYTTLKPISNKFEPEAMAVNGLDREALKREGQDPQDAMQAATRFIAERSEAGQPVLVAYPLGFDWSFLHWYFVRFAGSSPFGHSRGFDIKTAVAAKGRMPISAAGRAGLPPSLRAQHPHTHHALDDAIAQAQVFANVFEWELSLS